MAENAGAVIGIELLAAAQGCDFHAPLQSSPPLEAVRDAAAPRGAASRRGPLASHPDHAGGDADLVRSGARRRGAPALDLLPVLCAPEDPMTRIDNARTDPRAARHDAHGQELAHRSAAAHADEQPRSRGRREAGRARRLRRHRPRGARLGVLRPHRRSAAQRSKTTRRCWSSRASRSASSAPTPTRRAC